MDDALFQSMLAESYPTTPSLAETKASVVDEAYERKQQAIEPELAVLQSLEDGDSGVFSGGQGFRQQGIDTYETYHPGQLEDTTMQDNGKTSGEATRSRLERQKDRYAMQYGVDRGSIKDEDIYEQGAKQGLENLYNMTKKEGDADWTAGDTSYFRNNELELGSAESPLDIVIGKRSDGTQGKYGRELIDAINRNSGESANEMGLDSYNAAIYTDQGRFDPVATSESNIENSKYKGLSGIELEEAIYNDMDMQGEGENKYSSDDGTLLTGILKTGATIGQAVQAAGDTAMEAAMNGMEAYDASNNTLTDEKKLHYQVMRDAWNVNEKVWEKNLRINNNWSKKASAELSYAMDNGSSMDVVGSVLRNFDSYVADMAGETVMLFSGVGTAAAINRRVQIQKEELQKATGKEPTSAEVALIALTNSASLLMEKLVFIPVVAKPFKYMLGKTTSKVTPASRSIISNIAKRSMLVGGAALGEGVQETFDQAQENFWKKGGANSPMAAYDKLMSGKVLSMKEAKMAFAAGAIMSGTISGSTNTLGGLVDSRQISKQNAKNQREQDAGEYIAGEEQELATGLNEMSYDNESNNLEERLDHADSSLEAVNTFGEMVGSVSRDVRDIAKRLLFDKVEKSGDKNKEGYVKLIKKFVNTEMGKDPEQTHTFLTNNFGVDTTGMTTDEINKLIDESSIEENDKLFNILDPKKADEAIISLVNDDELGEIKNTAKEMLTEKRKRLEEKREEGKRFNANYNKGVEASPQSKEVPDGDTQFNFSLPGTTDQISGRIVAENADGSSHIQYEDSSGTTRGFMVDENGQEISPNSPGQPINGKFHQPTKKVGGRKNEIVDSKKVKKAMKRGILGTIKDIVTLTNNAKRKAIKELNNYTNEALNKSLADPAVDPEVKKYIKELQAKRKKASKDVGIDNKYFDSIKDLEVEKGNRGKTKTVISQLVKSKEIIDTRVRDAAYELLNSALEQKIITDKQHILFSKRVKKISENAQEPTIDELAAEKKANEENDVGSVEAENKNKIEVDIKDIAEQANEQASTAIKIDSEIKALESKNSRTPEEEAELKKLKSKFEKLNKRKENTAASILTLIEQGFIEDNPIGRLAGSPLFDMANKKNIPEFRTMEEAFSTEELAILGKIC